MGATAGAEQVEEVLGFGVVRNDLALVVEIDQVVRVESVASVDVFAGGEVSEREDDAGM